MRKLFTLSLAVAGAMAITATAATPQISFRPNDITRELPAFDGHIDLGSASKLSAPKHLSKTPARNNHAPIENDKIDAGIYSFVVNPLVNGGLYLSLNNVMAQIVPVEDEENTYAISFYMVYDATNKTTSFTQPIKGVYNPATKKLSIPSGQYLWEEDDAKYGHLTFRFWNVGLKKGVDETDGKTYMFFTPNNTDYEFVYEGGNSFVSAPYTYDNSADEIGYYAVFSFGDYETPSKGLLSYGLFSEGTIGMCNTMGGEYLKWIYYTDDNRQMVQMPVSTYNYMYPMGKGEIEMINAFGLGEWNDAVTFTIDRDNKKIVASTQEIVSIELQDGDTMTFYLDADDEDGMLTYDVEFNYEIVANGQQKVTTFEPNHQQLYIETTDEKMFGVMSGMFFYCSYDIELLDDYMSGIDEIATDNSNAPVEYFNIQGMKVNGDNLSNGVYVRRQGNSVEKVFVK